MKIRLLTVVCIALFCFLGWSTLKDKQVKENTAYNNAVEKAREKAKIGVNEKAYESYCEALKIRDSLELRSEIIEFLFDINSFGTLEKEVKELQSKYPKEALAYEYACRYAEYSEDIGELYSLAREMRARKISSEYVETLCEKHKHDFYFSSTYFNQMDPFVYGYARAYSKEGRVGFVDSKGNIVVNALYSTGAPYGGINYFVVITNDGDTQFLDMGGVKAQVDPQKRGMIFEDVQGFAEGQMAVCENGEYRYINSDYNDVGDGEKYMYAGMYNCGRAAVKDISGWYLIDKDHKKVSPVYEDIKLTENGVSVIGDMCICKKNDKWYIADKDGNIKNQKGYDDACVSLDNTGNGPIAVKIVDKWGYVSSDGTEVIKPIYDNARSFCRNYAAVEIDGLWTIINQTGENIMEPQFKGAYEMTNDGTIPVQTKKGWQMLSFYSK